MHKKLIWFSLIVLLLLVMDYAYPSSNVVSGAFSGTNGRIVFYSNRDGSWQIYSINPEGTNLTLSTVYRLFHYHGLMNNQDPSPIDRRRYEAESPNDIWQSDTMHGPMVEVDDKRRKSYLFRLRR